jgi:formate dehydrogenase subunit gamma
MARALFVTVSGVLLSLLLSLAAMAQDMPASGGSSSVDRSATGGAQTLADIMARQRGVQIDDSFRSDATGDPENATGLVNPLGTLGGVSDPELWRALRYGSADVNVSARGPAAGVVIQNEGIWWLNFREGPLMRGGAWLLGATLLALALFYLIRGRIRIDGEKTGNTVTRFKAVERFAHWLMGGSFIVLALTGLITLFGRTVLIPLFGRDSFALLAGSSKWIHNNISWAFIIGLSLVFFMWVLDNLPKRHDLTWLAQGGGILKKGVHPPAAKFNAGQKLIFWAVILLGTLVSLSGLSLLFPFELPLFAKTFAVLNGSGLPQLFGFGELPLALTPHQEMQYSQIAHALIAFVLMAIVLAHIYIGSVGMEGAFDAMGSGEVEEQWAREHHSLWLKEISSEDRPSASAPAPSVSEPTAK